MSSSANAAMLALVDVLADIESGKLIASTGDADDIVRALDHLATLGDDND